MTDQISSVSIWLRLTVTLALTIFLVAVSLIPGRAGQGDSVFGWAVALTPTPLQKLMHLLLYALLAFLWVWTLAALESWVARLSLAALLAIGLGASMEFAQTCVAGRFGTLTDALLNGAGAAIGLLLAWLLL